MKQQINKTLKALRLDLWRFITAIILACVIYYYKAEAIKDKNELSFSILLSNSNSSFIYKTDNGYWKVNNPEEIKGTVSIKTTRKRYDALKSDFDSQKKYIKYSLKSEELKKVSSDGTLSLTLNLTRSQKEQLGLNNVNIEGESHIKIKFDKLSERQLPLKIRTVGKLSDNRSVDISPKSISVWGTDSAWRNCENEFIISNQEINIDGVNQDFSQELILDFSSQNGRELLFLPNPKIFISLKISELQRWYEVPVRCCLSSVELNKRISLSNNNVKVSVKGNQPLPQNFNQKNIVAWVTLPDKYDGRPVSCRVNACVVSEQNGALLDDFKAINIEPQYIVVQELHFFHIGK